MGIYADRLFSHSNKVKKLFRYTSGHICTGWDLPWLDIYLRAARFNPLCPTALTKVLDALPNRVQLTSVSRTDVSRLAAWLEDDEVSDMWFGRYTYGDPAHLGYEPKEMISATEEQWNEVFHDPHHEPHRDIFSIKTSDGDHIGEAQLSIDEALGDAHISVLIGRKELWHHGYGTAATLAVLQHIFDALGLYRAWVDVPEYNKPALTMFKHLGFKHEGTLRESRPHHGARHNSEIMGMLSTEYRQMFPDGVINHILKDDAV